MPCVAHGSHRPVNLTTEQHHVIPQAWQFMVGPKLFDPRTEELCPTGHRNVHAHIVGLMHGVAALSAQGLAEGAALLKVQDSFPAGTRRTKEFQIALLAPSRWLDAGFLLATLIAHGEWGEA